MMKCRAIVFAIIAILLLANIALSDPVSDEEEKCHYIHLALYSGFGPNDPFLAEYNGVTLPHYIGYITIISDWRDKSFRSLSFTSTEVVPIVRTAFSRFLACLSPYQAAFKKPFA